MRFATIGMALLLLAGTASADACPPLTNYNVYITWANVSGSCSSQGAGCVAYDPIVFGFETFGVSLACSVHTFQWDFGDGTAAATAQRVVHIYAPGTYNVSLRITSPVQSVVLTSTITVRAPGRQRVVRRTSPPPPPGFGGGNPFDAVRAEMVFRGGRW